MRSLVLVLASACGGAGRPAVLANSEREPLRCSERHVSGVVVDNSGSGVPGATIVLEGRQGADVLVIEDAEGRFDLISRKHPDHYLVVAFATSKTGPLSETSCTERLRIVMVSPHGEI